MNRDIAMLQGECLVRLRFEMLGNPHQRLIYRHCYPLLGGPRRPLES